MKNSIILSTAYLAPIQYYTKMHLYNKVFIEVHENYQKQTYRNRCKIFGANGELSLSIPVKKNDIKVKTKDITIDYDTNWRKIHRKSIESAYRSSPFFEFYQDDLIPFYEKKYKFLIDFNSELQSMVLGHLGIEVELNYTNEYVVDLNESIKDFRSEILPKSNNIDDSFSIKQYTQVFQDRCGFIPNLSIIDLLFNEGPNAYELLKSFSL